jgi:hypothetical protein
MFTQAFLASGRSAVGSNPDVAEQTKNKGFVCSLVWFERRQKSDNLEVHGSIGTNYGMA